MDFSRRVRLGKTGLEVTRLGIGSSYGIDGDSVERAYSSGTPGRACSFKECNRCGRICAALS
jgi:hypothetical protein